MAILLVTVLASLLQVEAGTGCYDVDTHQCDCTIIEAACLQMSRTWTDGCNSCDASTNTHHPECSLEYSWGCFDEASHSCECQVSEKTCESSTGKSWTHQCWSCCHTSSWGCFVPGDGGESGCHCGLTETACKLDFPDATWSHSCHECSDTESTNSAARPSSVAFVSGLLSWVIALGNSAA
eukprot:Skav208908  [mRNA]  locus=scaffold270:623998:624540:- [translate_table: standard]